jgi:chromosome segregation ATPase
MIVSSITQTKAEVQKLIKQYNQLQQEAKTADTEEAVRKVAEAEKLVSQINTLQSALSKTKTKEFSTKPLTQTENSSVATTEKAFQRSELPDKKRIEFEERINRIESAQKRTRLQIEQLNRAKAELERLQVEAENAATVVQKQKAEVVQPQAEKLLKLNEELQIRNTQYQSLQKELDGVRKQAQKDTNLLRDERDAALERQKQLEKEKMNLLRYGGSGDRGFLNGLAIGAGLGILGLATLAVVIFKTPWLDEVVCYLKDYPTPCSFQTSARQLEDKK